jgi:hypothetical protein
MMQGMSASPGARGVSLGIVAGLSNGQNRGRKAASIAFFRIARWNAPVMRAISVRRDPRKACPSERLTLKTRLFFADPKRAYPKHRMEHSTTPSAG